jgi:hypothetical protein
LDKEDASLDHAQWRLEGTYILIGVFNIELAKNYCIFLNVLRPFWCIDVFVVGVMNFLSFIPDILPDWVDKSEMLQTLLQAISEVQ